LALAFILKRTKAQVGIQLPAVTTKLNVVEWKNDKEKELAEEIHAALIFSRVYPKKYDFLPNTLKHENTMTLMLRARQACIYPKMMEKSLDNLTQAGLISNLYTSYKEDFDYSSKLHSVIMAIWERRNNGCGKLVFCHFREEINEIARRLDWEGITVAIIDGRTSSAKRSDILNKKYDVIILQIQSGCEGLNLQENYSEIYFTGPHWNPAVEDQAIARCHRIGQTKPVFVQRFQMSKFDKNEEINMDTVTIDKYVGNVQDTKRWLVNEYIDNVVN
jgi:SNF2 family DNA or RNA helicase